MSSERKPVIVVTGASKGLGLAVTAALLKSFNAIVVTISRTRSADLTELLNAYPESLLPVEASVTDEAAVRDAINLTVSKYQHIDGLILNAGVVSPLGRIDSAGPNAEGWRSVIDVNFFSLIYAIQAALPALRKSELGGRIVFVSSGAAVDGMPGMGAYAASKAAMNSLCRVLALEEPEITAVALRPGMVDTPMQDLLRAEGVQHMRKDHVDFFSKMHSEGKLVKPEDSGHVIAALSVKAPKSLSGKFVRWDGDECKEFIRS